MFILNLIFFFFPFLSFSSSSSCATEAWKNVYIRRHSHTHQQHTQNTHTTQTTWTTSTFNSPTHTRTHAHHIAPNQSNYKKRRRKNMSSHLNPHPLSHTQHRLGHSASSIQTFPDIPTNRNMPPCRFPSPLHPLPPSITAVSSPGAAFIPSAEKSDRGLYFCILYWN